MAGLVVRDARRRRLRRLLGAVVTLVAPVLLIMQAADLSDVGPVVAGSAPAHVTVRPRLLTVAPPEPPISISSSKPTIPTAFATGGAAASADVSMHVHVLPGKAQWAADTTPSGGTSGVPAGTSRILSGRVLYTVGDNHVWQLVVHISGADGQLVQPQCSSINGATPDVGAPTMIGEAPIIVCQGSPGHSGGIFSVALDLTGTVSSDITVTVELIA